jgi:hypothetical protein
MAKPERRLGPIRVMKRQAMGDFGDKYTSLVESTVGISRCSQVAAR